MNKKLKENTFIHTYCIDYTVSKKSFELLHNKHFDLLITNPFPANLDAYYDSEDYISHTSRKKTIIDKLYHFVRNYTLKKKLTLINSLETGTKKILDIGCGTGDFIAIAKANSWDVTGVEPNAKARNIAREKKLPILENIDDIKASAFDVISLWHVLEHIPDLDSYILKISNLLKPNGTLIIAVPNFKSYDAQYYKEHWAAYDVPRHLWHFSKNAITKIFSHYNFELTKTIPMQFDSFYVSMLSEKYKNGKVNYFNAFLIGLRSNLKAKRSKEYSSHIYLLKTKKT